MNVTLSPPFRPFVQRQIDAGLHPDLEHLVHTALHLYLTKIDNSITPQQGENLRNAIRQAHLADEPCDDNPRNIFQKISASQTD